MKTRVLFFLLAGFLILPEISNGQIGYLRNKIINKIIDDQVDSIGKTKANENTGNKNTNTTPATTAPATTNSNTNTNTNTNTSSGTRNQSQGNTGNQGAFNLGNLGIGKVTLKYKDEYNFDGSIYMQMETYDKKDVTKMDYYTYYNSATPDAAIDVKTVSGGKDSPQGNSVFVFDGENKCLLMLTESDGNKTGIISTVPSDSALKAQNAGKPVQQPTIVKTGRTRVIAGYKCDEYKVTDVENKTYSNVWASKDIDLKADRTNWSKAGLPSYTTGFEGGLVLAMESYDNKDVLQMKTETIEIKSNIKHSVSPAGYSLMQMNLNQGTGK
jgi:hypothetical protein